MTTELTKQGRKEYKDFFQHTDGGAYFERFLMELIDGFHTQAESNPDLARDYTQRAKGVREVIAHVQSVTAGVK